MIGGGVPAAGSYAATVVWVGGGATSPGGGLQTLEGGDTTARGDTCPTYPVKPLRQHASSEVNNNHSRMRASSEIANKGSNQTS